MLMGNAHNSIQMLHQLDLLQAYKLHRTFYIRIKTTTLQRKTDELGSILFHPLTP
ncbi:hypothetical protein OIU74_010443, partial [Salix koriyanagi]